MTNASGAPRGRNLTQEKVRQLRIGRVRVYEEAPGTPPKEKAGADRAAPWGDAAYVVWGGSGPDGVRFPDGRMLDAEKLAAELAADPELAKLPQDVPVVLVVPHLADERYLAYLRAVANLLERPVWAPSGDGRLVRNKKREHVPALIDHGPDEPLGSWVPFRPTKKTAPLPDRVWTALDGTVFRDGDVLTRPLVSDRNERFGRMSHGDDARGREDLMRSYQRAKKQVHLMASGSRTALISEEPRTPDPASYVYVAHGLPGGLQLALRDGRTVWLGSADGGRYIGGLPEVTELPEGHRMKLEVCWSDSAGNPALPQLDNRPAPAVQDPLEEVSLAQHTANVSRRGTEGSLMSSGFHTDAHILHDAPGGVAGRRRWVVPEPLPHELDEMARTGGLHTEDGEASPEVRATTLRLVRALRIVFGPEAEQDEALHARLLRGIGAIETLRANDPGAEPVHPLPHGAVDLHRPAGGRKDPGPRRLPQGPGPGRRPAGAEAGGRSRRSHRRPGDPARDTAGHPVRRAARTERAATARERTGHQARRDAGLLGDGGRRPADGRPGRRVHGEAGPPGPASVPRRGVGPGAEAAPVHADGPGHRGRSRPGGLLRAGRLPPRLQGRGSVPPTTSGPGKASRASTGAATRRPVASTWGPSAGRTPRATAPRSSTSARRGPPKANPGTSWWRGPTPTPTASWSSTCPVRDPSGSPTASSWPSSTWPRRCAPSR
ncbi:lonely Cys domain-containing protein [Streptomyces sp. S1A(2023)]